MENYRLTQTGEEVQDILNGAAMQTDLTAENERAEGAEQTLQGNIDEEERRAKAAEETLSGAIGDEELRAKAAEEALGGAIDGINAKIPAAASSENKLADQDFVNSSIETATATFRGTYNLVSDLHLAVDATHAQIATLLGTVIAEADNNDYSYVLIPTSAQTPTEIASIEKYTFGANGWAFAYALNNSGFTSAQWAAINSGITSGLVAKLNALPTNTDLLALLAGKQDVLTFDNVPVEGSNNPVKSGGVHSAIDDEKTARVNAVNGVAGRVDTIEGEIPAQASSENQLADKAYVNSSISTSTATYRGSFNLVADLGLSVSATHEQIGTALAGEISTADNNDYAYVQVPTSDETPAQILKVERYKFNGTAWAFEYELNNSGFTSAQWAALNSGITSGLVGKLNALPTNDELTLALAGKQDVLTFDNMPTENSNNPVKSGGVYAADKALSDAIEAILLLIPSAATSLNKLVDTDLMNSSISTATATFRGTFNLVSDLSLDLTATHAQIATALAGAIATADNNDYCFVQIPTAVGTPTEIAQTDRYKFNGTAWAFEYTLNNSGFTSAQWAAINSAITTELVAKLTALPTNAELLESLGLLSSGISGINAKIPSGASSSNKLVDQSSMESYVSLIIGQLDATFNVQSTDGHVTLQVTQVDGVITSVQVTTSDIASAADLTLLAGRVTTAEGNITSLTGRMTTAESDIDTLTNLYNALQQSAPQVIQPTDTWPVANPSTTTIYRVIDRVNTPPEYYSDYMWNGTAFVLMATYNNAIDDVPTAGSDNLVKSGGVYDKLIQQGCINFFRESAYRRNDTIINPDGALISHSDNFAMYIPLYSSYNYIVARGIGSSYYPTIVTYDNNGAVKRILKFNDNKLHKVDLNNDEFFAYVNYYTDSYASGASIPLFEGVYLQSKGNIDIANNLNIKFVDGYVEASENGVVTHYTDYDINTVTACIDVQEDEQYEIKATGRYGARGYIVTDNNGNILDLADSTAGTTSTFNIAIPKGATKLYINTEVFNYQCANIVRVNKEISYDFEIDDKFFIYKNKRWNGGTLVDSTNAMATGLIPIKNCEYIYFKTLHSGGIPQVVFFNELKKECGILSATDGTYRHYKKGNIPPNAKYVAVVFDTLNATSLSFKVKGSLNYQFGKKPNEFVTLTTATPIKLIDANSLSGFATSVAPQIWGDDNYLYCVCDKRVTGTGDIGVSHIFMARYNKANGDILNKVVFESSYQIGRYHNGVVWKDVSGLLGTTNRLYVFALKVNADSIDKYVAELQSADESDFVYKYSDDNGENWSEAVSLKSYYPSGVVAMGPSPSQPIILSNGTLCIPGYVVLSDSAAGNSGSKFRCGLISYDNSWHLNVVNIDKYCATDNECTIAPLGNDNSIMINARNFNDSRSVYYTNFDLYSYKRHVSDNTFFAYNSYGCQGSLLKYGDFYLFTHIESLNTNKRCNLCVWASNDLCNFYPLLYITLNTEIGGYANLYVNDNKLYCVYESNRRTDISLVDITTDVNNALTNEKSKMIIYNDAFASIISKQREEISI